MIAYCEQRLANFKNEQEVKRLRKEKKEAHEAMKEVIAWAPRRHYKVPVVGGGDDEPEFELVCEKSVNTRGFSDKVWTEMSMTIDWAEINAPQTLEGKSDALYKAIQTIRRTPTDPNGGRAIKVKPIARPCDEETFSSTTGKRKRKRTRRVDLIVEDNSAVREAVLKFNDVNARFLAAQNKSNVRKKLAEKFIPAAIEELKSKKGRTRKKITSIEHGIDFVLELVEEERTVWPKAPELKTIVHKCVQKMSKKCNFVDGNVLRDLVEEVSMAAAIKKTEKLTFEPWKQPSATSEAGNWAFLK